MKNELTRSAVVGSCLMLLVSVVPVTAATITIDENGNGFIDSTRLSFVLANDPGPGGLPSVLTYSLPFAGVQGDIQMSSSSEGLNDVLRFNGNGTVIFYSDNVPGADAIGDTPAPPASFYTNLAAVTEVGPEGNNFALYTPLAGQPGYDPQFNPTYRFISDGTASAVPEPGSLLLLASGLAAAALARRTRSETLLGTAGVQRIVEVHLRSRAARARHAPPPARAR